MKGEYIWLGLFVAALAWFHFDNYGLAQESVPGLVISEVAWMGTTASANHEWIELANISDSPLDLSTGSGWTLHIDNATVHLAGVIESLQTLILERTSNNTLPTIEGLVYTGSLNNSGAKLVIKNPDGVVVDSLDNIAAWCSGDNVGKKTMERISIFNNDCRDWQTFSGFVSVADFLGNPISGSPAQISDGLRESIMDTQSTGSGSDIVTDDDIGDTATGSVIIGEDLISSDDNGGETSIVGDSDLVLNTADGSDPDSGSGSSVIADQDVCSQESQNKGSLFISEVLANPKGSDADGEYVEIFNSSGYTLDLACFYIRDTKGSVEEYHFVGQVIAPGGIYMGYSKDTGLSLNNDQEGVELLFREGSSLDNILLGKSRDDISYNKVFSDTGFTLLKRDIENTKTPEAVLTLSGVDPPPHTTPVVPSAPSVPPVPAESVADNTASADNPVQNISDMDQQVPNQEQKSVPPSNPQTKRVVVEAQNIAPRIAQYIPLSSPVKKSVSKTSLSKSPSNTQGALKLVDDIQAQSAADDGSKGGGYKLVSLVLGLFSALGLVFHMVKPSL